MNTLETAYQAELEGLCDSHRRAGEPIPTAADWEDFLSVRIQDIAECHELEEDLDFIHSYFTTRWADDN